MNLDVAAYLVLGTQFSLLSLLSIFGIHRAFLILAYLRNRKSVIAPSEYFDELPTVTVQLPVYNEPEVIQRLIECASNIDYPKDKLEIQILDDSTDSTRHKIIEKLNELAPLQLNIHHIQRTKRTGFKAGALAEGLAQASGELIAVFDADFLPSKDFLTRAVHYFCNPKVGMVQLRWTHLNREFSFLTRAQAVLLDGHFQIEHSARFLTRCFFNFNGTAGIWRAETIAQAGGWQGDTLTEDLDLSYRAQLSGSQFIYLVDEKVPAELPIELAAFKSQQHRWTKGSIEVLKKLGFEIFSSPTAGWKVKREAFFHLGANFCYPVLALVGLLSLPALEAENYLLQNEEVYLPFSITSGVLISLGFVSVFIFYAVAIAHSKSMRITHALFDLPLALITGIALSISNSLAVFEALFGVKSAFQRTPKTGSHGSFAGESYSSFNWRDSLIYVEIGLSCYFAITLVRAVHLELWSTIPFILLFFSAFTYFSAHGIKHLFAKRLPSRQLQKALAKQPS